ncbi:TolC family outer membrane protein [Phenylobacterium sp.]|jgi:outer membrane protein|uniref:TolC family outer membrane protein n=1 Tax=Phenylobacterium sp. TaxID=1871053 RepID=UPI002F93E507
MSKSLRGRLLAAIFSASAFGLTAAPAAAETLADAIAMAYETNPVLASQRATQRALDETYVQARSGWRPTLNFTSTYAYAETRTPGESRTFAQRLFGPGVTNGNTQSNSLSFNQPIWTGGRVAAAVSAVEADIMQGRENLRRVEAQVLAQVIQAYVDVRRDEAALGIRQRNVEVLQAQLRESQARFDVGEITRTDVALSESRLAGAQSLLQNAEAQLAISRANYAAAVGRNPGTLSPEPSLAYLMPPTVDEAFTVAETYSPLLRSQQFAEQASRARVAGARAERLPNISAGASLVFRDDSALEGIAREQFARETSVGVTVQVPIFNGGLTSSRIRQNIERNNADRITVETQRRSVLQQVTQSWNQLMAARAQIASTAQQVRAATIATEGTREEQKVGLRTTLDVLNAEQELRNAELSQVQARRDEYVAAATVLSAMGRLEARNLVPTVPQYDAKANFRRLRITWGWVPWEEPISIVDRVVALPPAPQPKDKPTEPPIGPGLQPPPNPAVVTQPQAAAPTPQLRPALNVLDLFRPKRR